MKKDKNVSTAEVAEENPGAVLTPAASHEAGAERKAKTARKVPWFRVAVIVIFALFYAYDLFEAITNTFGVVEQITKYNEYAELNGTNTSAIPWPILIANIVLPVAVFGLALLVARKRNVVILAVVLLTGLGVIGALTLTLIALV